jgi:hypothetical protein
MVSGDETMQDESRKKECIACRRNSDAVPLFSLDYRGSTFWICPQHFPVLIHRPAELIGLLPGAEGLRPSEIED